MTQITRDYDRILSKVWSEAPQEGLKNVWPQDAVKALKALFKREFPNSDGPMRSNLLLVIATHGFVAMFYQSTAAGGGRKLSIIGRIG